MALLLNRKHTLQSSRRGPCWSSSGPSRCTAPLGCWGRPCGRSGSPLGMCHSGGQPLSSPRPAQAFLNTLRHLLPWSRPGLPELVTSGEKASTLAWHWCCVSFTKLVFHLASYLESPDLLSQQGRGAAAQTRRVAQHLAEAVAADASAAGVGRADRAEARRGLQPAQRWHAVQRAPRRSRRECQRPHLCSALQRPNKTIAQVSQQSRGRG